MHFYVRFMRRVGTWWVAGARRTAGARWWTLAAVAAGPLLAGAVPLAIGLGSSVPAAGSAASIGTPAAPGTGPVTAPRPRRVTGPRSGELRTSCRAVAHIGDSTSVGLVSRAVLPDPANRLSARYARAGVRSLHVAASGGRSIVERLPGQANGYQVAASLARRGYRGCWVIALGTNDTANVAAGSPVGRMSRIARMMSAAHGEPVLWVNVKTLDASGPWAERNMRRWNAGLLRACARYPNLRVFDWAAVARNRWFIADGIHYTAAGYAARARLIAGALARAFPQAGRGPGCVVR